MRYLEVAEIVVINRQLVLVSGEQHNIWNQNGLEAAIHRHKQYENIFESSAALMHSLMNNHPFESANKRTALMSGLLILEDAGYRLNMNQVRLATRIEAMVQDHWTSERIAVWLRRKVAK